MDTGENAQGLRAIIDFLRKGSFIFLTLHFYFYCYGFFDYYGLSADFVDRIFLNIAKTGLFVHPLFSKGIAFGLLVVSLIGAKGKKDERLKLGRVFICILTGIALFFGSHLMLYWNGNVLLIGGCYIGCSLIGYLLLLAGGSWVSRLIQLNVQQDIFNIENETFPQEECLIDTESSLNFPAIYHYKGKRRQMYVNIQAYRSTLLAAGPGGGKTRYFIRPALVQLIKKGFVLFCYDFKFDDLTQIVYNALQKYGHLYTKVPRFCVINFDDLSRSHRCNPLDPDLMEDITDAAEASRSILVGLNRDWARRSGEFFVESPINFLTAIIWYLKKYKNGIYCTLPHAIELMMTPYDELFPILGSVEELKSIINPFLSAYLHRANEQLEGQVASAKIGLARLSSPQLYYVLSGNDFTLDINNPEDPKILCCGNNPLKIQTYGAVLSLYANRLLKLVNRKGMIKCALVFDEYPTIYCPMDVVVATGRSNKLAPILAVQSIEQMKKDYSKEQADVLVNICGNVVAGQSSGESAKMISERIGKIVQLREGVSVNRSDTSVNKNTQLDYAVPSSRISNLSPGEFVGTVADNPDFPVKLKSFHSQFQLDKETLEMEKLEHAPLPIFRKVTDITIQNNFNQIKNQVDEIVETEIERIKNTPELAHLIIIKPGTPPAAA